jgi:hypothetical protein
MPEEKEGKGINLPLFLNLFQEDKRVVLYVSSFL